MGMKELLIILVVVLVVFGARKLRSVGEDLGHAVRGFAPPADQIRYSRFRVSGGEGSAQGRHGSQERAKRLKYRVGNFGERPPLAAVDLGSPRDSY